MKSETNQQLQEIFKELAAIYRFMGPEEKFRSISYEKASKTISSLQDDVSAYVKDNTLEELPGIGKGIAGKIKEFLSTGTIKKYEQLKKEAPHELLEMMEIKGFGPQSLNRIFNELKISTKRELIEALKTGKIEKLKGFGSKKTEGLLHGLKLHKTIEDRMLLWDALDEGKKIVDWLKSLPGTQQVELAGSLRRKKETIGDLDILVSADEKHRRKIIKQFTEAAFAGKILVKGNTKASIILKRSGKQADLRMVNENEWGSALQYFTGSKEHNIHLRSIAKEKGYKISEYGIFHIKTNKKVGGKTEEDIYSTLGFQFIPEEMRENKGEIELAKKHKIPKLILPEEIKGDLHIHSTWSDGLLSIKDIVKFVKQNFSYEYIAITDHSRSSRIANGMDEKKILKQIKEIECTNKELGENFVKKGIEVDILPDGKLDISDEVLAQLDWVIASVHSGFKTDNTERIIRACNNPYVSCIGHPSGRLIGLREEYKIDIPKLIEAANTTNTALEINSQPQRMDLCDEYVMLAREKKAKLVINTDSHKSQDFYFMNLGISIARRAWCTSENILNTKPWPKLFQLKKIKSRA